MVEGRWYFIYYDFISANKKVKTNKNMCFT